MLASLRKYAKTWFAAIIVIALMLSFLLVGTHTDLFGGRPGNWVIAAGKRTVSGEDFRRAFDNYRQNAQQQTGQEVTTDMAVKAGLDQRLLNEMASQEALMAMLQKMGVKPSDKLVADVIAKAPAFRDPVSGAFDKDAYQRALAQEGLTPAKAEGVLRDQIAARHLEAALAAGFAAPRTYTAVNAALALEQRDLDYFVLTPSTVAMPAPPTDAQLTAFMKENAAQLTRPEIRTFTLVRFSPKALEAGVKVDPAEVQKRFDFKKDSLARPETRSLVQIPAKDQKTAADAAARLAKGEAPAAVAKALGVDPITYADKPKTAIADRKVADAAFGLPAGQVSGPIQGALGWAVVKVTGVTPGETPSLEAVRPQIEAEVRADAAKEKVYAQTQAYDAAHSEGASVADAARKAGAQPISIGPVAANGADASGKPNPLLTPEILKAAFETPAGGESELIDAGGGEYFALKVDKVTPPTLPPLAEVKVPLARAWAMQELRKRLTARGEALVGQIKKGQTLEQAAASAGVSVGHATSLDRARAAQNQQLGRDVLVKVFSAKTGDVFSAMASNGVLVGRLTAVRPGEMAELARGVEVQKQQAVQGLFRDFGQVVQTAAAKLVKVQTSLERARLALGLDPEDAKAGADAAKDDAK